ncbi:MAG TPA: hypothetical protein VH000_04350 [Rhizomicrobium sp.]|jgi:predicted protein tyrosine phosphatase|nr:hypothetical protein [Rhizomicrobium sp.]HEX4533441.1 hypothetical protein [Rhizomicrobium sp.]
MPQIIVTPLSAVPAAIKQHRPSHMVTLLSPEHMIETPDGILASQHLKLGMNDIAEARMGDAPPAAAHVASLIEFGRGWSGRDPMLVHCWAGISRSMAATFVILTDRLGAGSEMEIARAMRFRAPHAYPNRLIVQLADHALQRQGRMVEAIEAIGSGTIVAEGQVVAFPIARREL